jgi:hypothetical protein
MALGVLGLLTTLALWPKLGLLSQLCAQVPCSKAVFYVLGSGLFSLNCSARLSQTSTQQAPLSLVESGRSGMTGR